MNRLFILVFALFMSVTVFAQVPQAFNYQGVARDLSGTPIPDKNIGLRITILQGTFDGEEVYKEIHLTTTNNLGLFSIPIGKGTPAIGVFEEIDWSNGDHFVQIEMDENGGSNYQLIGTSQLLSVPYALQAGNSFWSKDEQGRIFYASKAGENKQVAVNSESIDPITGELITSILRLGEFRSNWPSAEGNATAQSYPAPMLYFIQEKTDADSSSNQALILRSSDALEFRVQEVEEPNIPATHLVITEQGTVGIGTTSPKAKLQVAKGDVYIENIGHGVIMRSTSGQCWRLTIDNVGRTETNAVACPE